MKKASLSVSQSEIPYVADSAIVFEDFLKIRRDKLVMPNKAEYNHFIIETRDTAVVTCAQTTEDLWVLTEEYRHPTKKFILGLPGGYLEVDEDPIVGAGRELLEETGYFSNDFTLLGSAYPYAGVSGQKTFFILAENAFKQSVPTPEPTELLRTVLKTKQEIHTLLKQGYPVDANLCTAFYLLSLRH